MNMQAETVRAHYQAAITDQKALLTRVSEAVDAMELPINAGRLAALDQFHVGGLAATIAFAERVAVTSNMRVLDAGSGLGGPARYLAATFACQVDGVDLAPNYVAVATMLTQRAGLTDRVRFREGDLTELPFADGTFDLVWTQHVAMNVNDRIGLYRELRRVLASDGRLAFYDPVAADGHPDLIYPVPWAETAATSTLLSETETRSVLERSGFAIGRLDDVTADAIGWAQFQSLSAETGAANTAMIVGPRMAGMAANFALNLREGRVRLVMGIAKALG